MAIKNEKFLISTNGFCDIIDITETVSDVVTKTGLKNAVVHVFVVGSTASITTLEYEPGLVKDFPDVLEKLIPSNSSYHHDETWHDGNGFAHIRASIIGNSVSVPLIAGSLELGTWQQIVLIDFDNKKRTRSVIVQTVS